MRPESVRTPILLLAAAALVSLTACSLKNAAPPAEAIPSALKARSAPALEVVNCRLTAGGEFVAVRFRLREAEKMDLGALKAAALLDETTGERYEVLRLQRIGRLAEFRDPDEKGLYFVMFRNREGKLRAGKRVTLEVGPGRYEHILLLR